MDASPRLPTGARLDPEGRSFDVGNMPLGMLLAPEGDHLILSLNGWREQGVQVVERATGRVVQTLTQPAAFLGLVFSPDGKTLYASGGNEDAVYRYSWRDGRATLIDHIALAEKATKKDGTRFPAGLAMSRDGRYLYVAENLADTLAVIDTASKRIVQRLKTDHYPYNIAVAADARVYVSAWGGDSVAVFNAASGGLTASGKIVVGRHPSALVLNTQGTRLFVASASNDRVIVVDTTKRRVIKELLDAPPAGPREGSTPDALALSPGGGQLFVAEADNNAVAVFDLSSATAGQPTKRAQDRLAGRIPVGWYPTALVASPNALWVLNGKGRGTMANPDRRKPGTNAEGPKTSYVLGQLNGTITELPLPVAAAKLNRLTAHVAELNNWGRRPAAPRYPPFKHVIYVIKENRTYDQMFGDLKAGDGDPALLFFSQRVIPNHRALAERFGLFDRFFVTAEVSSQGHQWSTSAYSTDYTEKITPSSYSSRRGEPDDVGEVDEPVNGYLWDAALRKGITLRNYGEFALPVEAPKGKPQTASRYRAVKTALAPHTNPDYPSFDMAITDQKRVEVWLKEFQEFAAKGTLPALEIVHLPCDHTGGARPWWRTPAAYVADNDFALGRMVEAVSKSAFWKDTVFFVLEDDAQDGPDHVDSHRSVLIVISPYNRAGTLHRFVNTTDVIATMEEILGLGPLSQFDYYGRPLREIFAAEPDLRPYDALKPAQPLYELNPQRGHNAQDSLRLDFSKEDRADMALFNRVLWRAIKGDDVPYPSPRQMAALEYLRGR